MSVEPNYEAFANLHVSKPSRVPHKKTNKDLLQILNHHWDSEGKAVHPRHRHVHLMKKSVEKWLFQVDEHDITLKTFDSPFEVVAAALGEDHSKLGHQLKLLFEKHFPKKTESMIDNEGEEHQFLRYVAEFLHRPIVFISFAEHSVFVPSDYHTVSVSDPQTLGLSSLISVTKLPNGKWCVSPTNGSGKLRLGTTDRSVTLWGSCEHPTQVASDLTDWSRFNYKDSSKVWLSGSSHEDLDMQITIHSEDYLCIKRMTIQYECEGSTHFKVETEYNFTVKIPSQATHIRIWFDVVGGSCVWAVDRNKGCKWLDNYNGREVFYYPTACRREVTFHLKGTSLRSYVSKVEDSVCTRRFSSPQDSNEMTAPGMTKIQVTSTLWCIKRMTIQYEYEGSTHFKVETGYDYNVKIPCQARHVLIWFDVIGGSCVWAVDRNKGCKWLDKYSGREVFYFASAFRGKGQGILFELQGSLCNTYVSKVEEIDEIVASIFENTTNEISQTDAVQLSAREDVELGDDSYVSVGFQLEPGSDSLENQAREAAKNVQRIIEERNATECVFFIHGFNNDTKTIRDRAKSINQSLQSPQILTIAFEWPSQNSVFGYWADRSTCDNEAIPYFKVFLDTLCLGGGTNKAVKSHFIAHSMGNRILLGVADKVPSGTLNVSLAADVSQDDMKVAVKTFHGDLWTHYFCRDDWVLRVSNVMNGTSRAGLSEIETQMAGVESIRMQDGSGHSYLDVTTVQRDMAVLLKEKRNATQRCLVREGTYYVFSC